MSDTADPPPPLDPAEEGPGGLERVEQELGAMVRNLSRFKHQINGDRLDRMALMVLGALSAVGRARLTVIAERTGLDASTASRQVADLERAGLLVREVDPDDRRAILLQTTEKGVGLMTRLSTGRRRRLERMLADWSEHDIEEFGRLMARLNAATEKYGVQNALEVEQELNSTADDTET